MTGIQKLGRILFPSLAEKQFNVNLGSSLAYLCGKEYGRRLGIDAPVVMGLVRQNPSSYPLLYALIQNFDAKQGYTRPVKFQSDEFEFVYIHSAAGKPQRSWGRTLPFHEREDTRRYQIEITAYLPGELPLPVYASKCHASLHSGFSFSEVWQVRGTIKVHLCKYAQALHDEIDQLHVDRLRISWKREEERRVGLDKAKTNLERKLKKK